MTYNVFGGTLNPAQSNLSDNNCGREGSRCKDDDEPLWPVQQNYTGRMPFLLVIITLALQHCHSTTTAVMMTKKADIDLIRNVADGIVRADKWVCLGATDWDVK